MGAGLARLLSGGTNLVLTEPVPQPSEDYIGRVPALDVVERVLYVLGYWREEATQ